MLDLHIDLGARTGLAGSIRMAVSVFLPEPERRLDPPVALFLYPGGGYARGYFNIDWPGRPGYSEAAQHAANGYIVIACDHLGVGDSEQPIDRSLLTYAAVAEANDAAARLILERLTAGTLASGVPPVEVAAAIGIGQSMGGGILTVQQARHCTFAAIGLLGWSGIHCVPPVPPETGPDDSATGLKWIFHLDDVPIELAEADMAGGYPSRGGNPPMWASPTIPEPIATTCMDAGCVADDAAAIDVPVFVGVGERDLSPDPRAEPTAYPASPDITVFVLPGSAHMHNFSSARVRLWDRLEHWVQSVLSLPGPPRR